MRVIVLQQATRLSTGDARDKGTAGVNGEGTDEFKDHLIRYWQSVQFVDLNSPQSID